MNFKEKTFKQLKLWYSNKKSESKNKLFEVQFSFEEFEIWYRNQPKVCHYCGLTEIEQFDLIHSGILTSNRFFTKKNGKRGMYLEIDRKSPKGNYSIENSVFCCYFCNNDKSDIFSESQYKSFNDTEGKNHRVSFLRSLLWNR
jgi:hypothetical protein